MTKWYSGIVIHGEANGRKWGYPTANLGHISPTEEISIGVYAVKVKIENAIYHGMMYVGTRPTLNMLDRTHEIFLFNFAHNIYDATIQFCIVEKIRDEIHFKSIESLIAQLNKDAQVAKQILHDI